MTYAILGKIYLEVSDLQAYKQSVCTRQKKAEHLQLSHSPETSMCSEGSLVPLQLCRPFPRSSWAGGAAAASASPCSSWQVRLFGSAESGEAAVVVSFGV